MVHLFDVAVFTTFVVILLQLMPQRRTQEIHVWTDDVERRMMR